MVDDVYNVSITKVLVVEVKIKGSALSGHWLRKLRFVTVL
jgi:hypothetical protein